MHSDDQCSSVLIVRIRRQLVLHSILYYQFNQTVWTDKMFDRQSVRLVELQKEHGTSHGYKDDLFADWTGDTGFHLTKNASESEMAQAIRVSRYHKENYGESEYGPK